MKKLFCIIGALALCATANAQWIQQTTNTTADLKSIHFPASSIGYIAGDFGGYGGYLKTTDGGNTWNSELITFAPFQSIHFANADTGAAVGYNIYFRTTDGGATWSNPAPPSSYTHDVWSFTNNRVLIGSGFNLYKSFNGGSSWAGQSDTASFEDFYFLDQSTGYSVGWDGTFNYRGVISKTTDQGATWSHTFLPNYSTLSSVNFPSANVGYAVGSNRVVKTGDGGNTWNFLNVDSTWYYTDVYFSSNTLGHVVGQTDLGFPVIISTNDGGNTWIPHVLGNTIRSFQSVWCTDNNTCFAAGDSGIVYKTTNAGAMGIEEQASTAKVKAYPNPFNESITISIEGNGLKNGTICIYDVTGREIIMMNDLSGDEVNVSRNNLPDGIYFYSLRDGERTVGSGKIIAQ